MRLHTEHRAAPGFHAPGAVFLWFLNAVREAVRIGGSGVADLGMARSRTMDGPESSDSGWWQDVVDQADASDDAETAGGEGPSAEFSAEDVNPVQERPVDFTAMTRAEERRLIERAIAGDRTAAAEIIRAHQPSLYAYMLRISGRPETAEDIVQDAFVRALTNLHRFDFKFRFSTWLFTIAKRLHVNACQKHKPAYDSEVVGVAEGRPDAPEGRTIGREVSDNAKLALEFALKTLSEEQREIVVLFHQLDWPIAQIAEYMQMPEGTIKSHLHRGRQRMRAALAEHSEHSRHVGEVFA